jgi:hypothetical protein
MKFQLGQPIVWRGVFSRWLRARPVIERIEYADVTRYPGIPGAFEYVGPVVVLTQAEIER